MNQALRGAACVAFLACIWPLRAQHTSYVAGAIFDSSGASVPGVLVTVLDEETGFRRSAISQPDGGYLISALAPGRYRIAVRKPGFRTMIRYGVQVGRGDPASIDFTLTIGSVLETITVEGTPPLLDTQDAAVSTRIEGDSIGRLVLNGRTLLSVLELAPGVIVTPATRGESGQFTVNGQRPNTNYFTVDGVSANSGVSGGGLPAQSTGGTLPSMTAFGSMGGSDSLDSLQELRIQTSTAVPEFGRLPGAQVSLSSRAGSNEWHGGLLFGARNEALSANSAIANAYHIARPPLRLYDTSADLGGPLKRNRAFFFLSYEGLRLTQPFVEELASPTLAARESAPAWAQSAIGLFPLPNRNDFGGGLGAWLAGYTRPSTLNAGSARLDYALTPRITLFGHYTDSASSTEYGPATVNWLDLRSKALTGGFDLRARANLLFAVRSNWSFAETNSVWQPLPSCYLQPLITVILGSSASCSELVRLSISAVGEVVSGSEGRRTQSQAQVSEVTSWEHAGHTLHLGADFRRLSPVRDDVNGSLSILANGLADLTSGSNFWSASSPAQHLSATVSEGSLFAEDTWRLGSRVTFVYGVRWELSPAPSSSGTATYLDPATGATVQAQRPIWQAAYRNFAPRAGVAYRLTKSGRTVVRAGGGLFYNSSLSLATDLVNDGPLNMSQFGSARLAPFGSVLLFGYLSRLGLPKIVQWNVSVEHALTNHDVVSASYVGSAGRDLIRREIGGPGTSGALWLELATNHGSSDYESLQLQYRRRLAHGLELLGGYSWSHSIDNSSADSGLYWTGPGVTPSTDRGSSDFDVRHVFTLAASYQIAHWALDGMLHARTGFPFDVLDSSQFSGIGFENAFRPDLVVAQPVWIADASVPGGKRLNPAAFTAETGATQGNLGRNALTGFGAWQLDLALRRVLFHHEQWDALIRLEAFNVLNHPNFADPVRYLTSPLFGQSTSMLNLMLGTGTPASGLAPLFQTGGPRNLQLSIRLRF